MKYLTLFFVLFLMVLSIGCSTATVDYDYDPEFAFDRLRSYDWFPVPRENVRYDLLIKQIKSSMKRQLNERGFRMVSEDPDFLIALHGGIQSKMDYLDWEYLYENYEPYWATRRIDITRYTDNQLIVDYIDTQSRELVYRAIASVYIPEVTPDERQKIINKAVMKILDNYPSSLPAVSSR